MSLKTRLDGRSTLNNSFKIKDDDGKVVAEISVSNETSSNLNIKTLEGHYIEKPSGWTSK
jgi:hypothetical protein